MPCRFHARIAENQQEYHQWATQLEQAITERDNRIKTIQYNNVPFRGKKRALNQQISVLLRCYVNYLANEDKNNGMVTIPIKDEAAENPYIFICEQHDYRRHKTRELLTHNQGNAIIGDRDPPKAIVKYNFQGQHRLSVVNPDRPRHLKLDIINREVL